MSNIKSITTVRATGNGNNGNWVARMRLADGTELFGGLGAGYTLAQAQMFVRSNPANLAFNDPFSGNEGKLPYEALPAGVTISVK
jgi:hypothetical protein